MATRISPILVAAILTLAPGAAFAEGLFDTAAGYLSFGVGQSHYPEDGWGPTYEPYSLTSVDGGLTFNLANGQSIQVDLAHWTMIDATNDYDLDATTITANYSTGGAFGFFGGLFSTLGYYGTSQHTNFAFGGVNYGMALAGDIDVVFQAGVLSHQDGPYEMINDHLYFASANAEYVVAPGWTLTGDLGMIAGEFGDNSGEYFLAATYGVGLERSVTDTLTAYVAIDGMYNFNEDSFSRQNTDFMVGLRIDFGAGESGSMPVVDFRDVAWLMLDNW